MNKYVYNFAEGNKSMKKTLGGKGANLAEMTNIGLSVPAGFTITTEACNQYFKDDNAINSAIRSQIDEAVSQLELQVEKSFGGSPCLLVSVRSGSVISMPGMMDTILNLGLNDENVKDLGERTGSMRFSLDCYRRFIQMYSNVVLEIPMYHFESILVDTKERDGLQSDQELSVDHLHAIIQEYKRLVLRETGRQFEQSPKEQMYAAIEAVFRSWNNERAKIYRRINSISDKLGTAVNVQMMVFGNLSDASGTGVLFTRNPSTGENVLYGEYLMNAQGEDVVAGIRTPKPIQSLQEQNPAVYDELVDSAQLLENHYSDMQDIEFTIENGKFYLLQTRNGKRSAAAAVKIAVDFVNAGIIKKVDAIKNFDANQIDQLLHPEFDKEKLAAAKELTIGLPASPGAATGQLFFDAKSAEKAREEGKQVILVRMETSPEDISGMISSNGVLTARGGMTSHAAVVARGMGKCCISGCIDLEIEEENRIMRIGDLELKEGDFISLDGRTGKVYLGQMETTSSSISEDFIQLMAWSDEFSKLTIMANADTPFDASRAKGFGAKGIGLCRTEHMFFEGNRITDMREMIMADTEKGRKIALEKLYPYQKDDFKAIFKIMETYPVNIRLLDPPLHEFLPKGKEEIQEMAKALGMAFEQIEKVVEDLHEVNPMMGLRGCRLGLTYPEIYEMQTKAIINAALEAKREEGFVPTPEIMIPLVGNELELAKLRTLVERLVAELDPDQELGHVKIGTMIEVPRACVVADKIAEYADYFSFGTNDLTQMTMGFSRDDAGVFIRRYREKGILDYDPFQKLDQEGVGALMRMAIEKGKQGNASLKIGICGEQAGDTESLRFINTLGLDYASCSPFRIPKARFAAGQAGALQAESQANAVFTKE
ncbi:pyruvate, phosphate dikinase [Echinicola pacifica]|uniref:Pyruvate, phosphate dikinase n=1 Tax=Echinicola pacifica TaxID=346377 RepID=A0A918Q8T7_9BACT|nr:pyruvate, phosphate dikinase [Echinicola pacifica]GGZ37570.1 pyruvate, phosphate dikinase [Echinicola pacifica]